jgi:hypothetical protein
MPHEVPPSHAEQHTPSTTPESHSLAAIAVKDNAVATPSGGADHTPGQTHTDASHATADRGGEVSDQKMKEFEKNHPELLSEAPQTGSGLDYTGNPSSIGDLGKVSNAAWSDFLADHQRDPGLPSHDPGFSSTKDLGIQQGDDLPTLIPPHRPPPRPEPAPEPLPAPKRNPSSSSTEDLEIEMMPQPLPPVPSPLPPVPGPFPGPLPWPPGPPGK